MKRLWLILFLFTLIFSGICFAVAPVVTAFERYPFQGYLTDANGDPLNGSYDLTIACYTAATGGTTLFSESHSGVTVTNGVFNVLIGDGTVITPTSADIFNGDVQYLGVTVGSGTEITPRTVLAAVPYAFCAKNVTGETISVKKEGTTDIPVYAQNTQGIAVYARGGAAGVVGSSEANNGYGLEGHAHGAFGVGVYGRAHLRSGWGVTAVNTDSTGSTGGALNVIGKIKVDTGHGYSCAGSGSFSGGTDTNITITNANVTDSSMIFLMVSGSNAITNGGIRVSSITSGTSFVVTTMDGNVASASFDFDYLIVN